ncbi:MAG: large conductance mechanosensitive channel protein MscL [Eubacteriales bacterium]|nr:large conductance mechanosensitive channel protein MscL [Eubacteriales bacterium]
MGFFQEFKQFISKGNVMDMAVGIIIGGAFTSIVTSLCEDIISPILGIFGGLDFSEYVLDIGGATLKYGNFITTIINFLIMALVVFCIVKSVNGAATQAAKLAHLEKEEAAPTTKVCPFCKSEIALDATRCPHCTSKLDE